MQAAVLTEIERLGRTLLCPTTGGGALVLPALQVALRADLPTGSLPRGARPERSDL